MHDYYKAWNAMSIFSLQSVRSPGIVARAACNALHASQSPCAAGSRPLHAELQAKSVQPRAKTGRFQHVVDSMQNSQVIRKKSVRTSSRPGGASADTILVFVAWEKQDRSRECRESVFPRPLQDFRLLTTKQFSRRPSRLDRLYGPMD